jgi:hypothetical protein
MAISEPTNADRADWAKAALAVFTQQTYSGDHPDTMEPGDLETAIQDLISDLIHLASQKGMDVKPLHRRALVMFEAEFCDEDETVCTCRERSWYGAYHDTQCPLRIAADAHRNATGGTNV